MIWKIDNTIMQKYEMASLMLSNKKSACNERDMGSISELGKYPRGRNGNPLQYSCLKNPKDTGAWHGVQDSDKTERLSTHAYS